MFYTNELLIQMVKQIAAMHKSRRVRITDLNPHLSCVLCSGYLIDATTIIECLHSFCRTCIVKYLENNKYCPICDVQVHKTKPLLNIRSDQTLQDIVYKLVPGLFQNEMSRRRDFYAKHPEHKPSSAEESGEVTQFSHIYTADESISLSLEYYNNNVSLDNIDNNITDPKILANPSRRFLRCPAAVSVSHLQKLIRAKYGLSNEHRVDILYLNDRLNEDFTLMDIAYIYLWRRKGPLHLTYRIFEVSKRMKLNDDANNETTDTKSETDPSTNGGNEWKEVQLQISENGIMSVTNIAAEIELAEQPLVELKTEVSVPEIPDLTPILPKPEKVEPPKEPAKTDEIPEDKTKEAEVKLGKHKLEDVSDSEPSAKIVKTSPPVAAITKTVKNVQQLSRNHPLKIHSQTIKCSTPPPVSTGTPVVLKPQPIVVKSQPKINQIVTNNNNNAVKLAVPKDQAIAAPTSVQNNMPILKLVTPKTTVQSQVLCPEKHAKIPQNCSSPSFLSTALTPPVSATITTSVSAIITTPVSSIVAPPATIVTLTHTSSESSYTAMPNIPKYTQAGHSTETTTTTSKSLEHTQNIKKQPQPVSSPVVANNCIQSSKVSIVPKKSPVKIGTPIGYKTLRDPPKAWNPQISRQTFAKTNNLNPNNGASTSDPSKIDPKAKPAKFFKMRNNMPRYLGNPASGVKPLYHVRDGDKSPPDPRKTPELKRIDSKMNNNNKDDKETEIKSKPEVKKLQSIVKIDPKTLRPILDKVETPSCSEVPEMKINQSSVPIFNPLRNQKSQSSPKLDRRSPKSSTYDVSPKSPLDRTSKVGKPLNSPTGKPLNSPTTKKDKLNINFTPPNPFIPNLTSPNMGPNQFLYPNYPSYDPRVMNNLSAYHNLQFPMFYSQPRLNYPGLSSQNLSLTPNLMSSLNLEVNKNLRKNYDIPAMLQLSPTLEKKKAATNVKVELKTKMALNKVPKQEKLEKKEENRIKEELKPVVEKPKEEKKVITNDVKAEIVTEVKEDKKEILNIRKDEKLEEKATKVVESVKT